MGTLIAFRVGVRDSELLEDYFRDIGTRELTEQPNYHAYIRLLVEGKLTPPFSVWTELEVERSRKEVRERLVEQMRRYARPRKEVEAEISLNLKAEEEQD